MALAVAGKVQPGQADIVVAALDFMAGAPINGQRRIDVDLSMQHGRLTIGPFTLLRLAPLWSPP